MSAIPKDVGIKPEHNAQPTPDGAPAREYRNDGTGLTNVSGQNYNEALGRVASSPTSGLADGRGKTPRGEAPAAPDSGTAATPYLV